MTLFNADYGIGYAFTAVWLLAYALSAAEEWLRNRYRIGLQARPPRLLIWGAQTRPKRVAVGLLTAAEPLPGLALAAQIIPAVAVAAASLAVGAWTTVLVLHTAHAGPLAAFTLGLIAAAGLEALVIGPADNAARTVRRWLAHRKNTVQPGHTENPREARHG